jgi:hypothetical protein
LPTAPLEPPVPLGVLLELSSPQAKSAAMVTQVIAEMEK